MVTMVNGLHLYIVLSQTQSCFLSCLKQGL